MRVCVFSDNRFDRTPDGIVWAQLAFPHAFWMRYLDVFDKVRVVARVRDVEQCAPGWVVSSGDRVSFYQIPYYLGIQEYVLRRRGILRAARASFQPEDAVILRAPGQIGYTSLKGLWKTGHPYAVEVIGDPYDAMSRESYPHPLQPLLQWLEPRKLRRAMRGACAGGYVTSVVLPEVYPVSEDAFWTNYSSINLAADMIASAPRAAANNGAPIQLIQVCTLQGQYKAVDVVVDAVAQCVKDGLDLRLTVCGDGQLRGELEARARNQGLGDRVQFPGLVKSGRDVLDRLDQADVFLLPSRQEGLPRAMIEAMARGLPCIGSTVGGIPELLPPTDLVPPGDVEALTRKIREFVTSPERRTEASRRNLQKAREYENSELQKRRDELYRHLKANTAAWLEKRSSV